ncbi:MAG: AAA family ATPase [Polyangiaceae bacterium]|nr:AAA family ATPase [Polyangiaceae bacterium]MCW5789059.1 AAA family ATPase [Polyangiaceae bacterium]
MLVSPIAESELQSLRKLAEAQAAHRRERLTSAHLLAAIALCGADKGPSPAAELLEGRGLSGERLLRAARASTDELEQPIRVALSAAQDVADRMGARAPGATHLLVALLNERRSAAYKALEQCGVEVARLRIDAMNVGLGLVGRRRIVTRKSELEAQAVPRGRGVAIPLFPPAERPSAERLRVPSGTHEGSAPAREGRAARLSEPPAPESTAQLTITTTAELTEAPPGAVARTNHPAQTSPDAVPDPEGITNPVAKPEPSAPRGPAAPIAKQAPVTAPRKATAPPSGKSTKNPPGNKSTQPERRAERRPKPKARGAEQRFQLDPKRQPALTAFGKNLSLAAARGELDQVVGRDAEVQEVLDVLAKRHGNNPCLVGAAGVGKTSVVRALAQHVADAEPGSVDERVIVEIPVGELVAGTGVRGALAERLQQLRREVREAEGRVVLFFDEIHQLLLGEAADEIAGELKLAWARGELPCIGATTQAEYQRTLGADAALARRFTRVEVEEPSREDALAVLSALAPAYEAHHHVSYQEEALERSVAWSVRYMPGQMLPDKAVSIVDLAGARARRRRCPEVSPELVAEVVSDLAEVPVERLLETDGARMLRLVQLLSERVVGHERQLSAIAKILRRNTAGLTGRRPIGTFLLLGPTGVGKTETAKAVAEVLFYSERCMTRLDMAEYSEPHAVARLVGAPPGYVGHEAGGALTEAVRRRPYQVVLLDEIEKAHPEVLETFLGVFDEGRLTDSKGRTVDFTNTVILITSNLGAQVLGAKRKQPVGFGFGKAPAEASDLAAEAEAAVIAAARAALAPELYNRIDEALVFQPLSRDDVREITRRLLARLGEQLWSERGVELSVDDVALDALLELGGFDVSLGARPMKRTLARLVEAPLAERLLDGSAQTGDCVQVSAVRTGTEPPQITLEVQRS